MDTYIYYKNTIKMNMCLKDLKVMYVIRLKEDSARTADEEK